MSAVAVWSVGRDSAKPGNRVGISVGDGIYYVRYQVSRFTCHVNHHVRTMLITMSDKQFDLRVGDVRRRLAWVFGPSFGDCSAWALRAHPIRLRAHLACSGHLAHRCLFSIISEIRDEISISLS